MIWDDRAVNNIHNIRHQMTSFIGREEEIREIIHRLNNPLCQLLTFVGPGGIGKTRLALEVAHQMSLAYPDGVYFVPLQPLRSAEHIPSAIAHALELPNRDDKDALQHLIQFLRERQLLLILDNFEHLVEGAAVITPILADAAAVRVLVTSREPLKLHEEWQWMVQGLKVPASHLDETAQSYSAVQLFAERAEQIHADFVLEQQLKNVIRICQLVEGIPLAIEMAANWTNMLTCEAIAEAIQNDIDFLTSREQNIPERHRSMRAVYNHSWRLLYEEERQVFQKLSIFRSGFTLEAAEQIAEASLETLASLVDKSFLRTNSAGRHDIHELLRQYGEEQLTLADSTKDVANRHAVYFADFVKQCEAEIKSDKQRSGLNKFESDFENIRAAWTYAVTQRDDALIDRMIDGLYWFGHLRSRVGEICALFEIAADTFAPVTNVEPHPVWWRLQMRIRPIPDTAIIDGALELARTTGNESEMAFCLLRHAYFLTNRHLPHALDEVQKALEIYGRIGDGFGVLNVLTDLTYHLMTVGDIDRFDQYNEQTLEQLKLVDSPWHRYQMVFRRGWGACFEGQYEACRRDLTEALSIADQMGFLAMEADSVGSLAFLSFLEGDFQQAKPWIRHDLETVIQVKSTGEEGFAKIVLAHVSCVEGNYHEAQRLAEEALSLVKPHPVRERFIARVLAMTACGVGDFKAASEQARSALKDEPQTGIRLWILPVFALLLAHDGDFEAAAELLGLIFTHPASATGWLEKWSLMNDLRMQLAQELGVEAYAGAWERGTTLKLDTVVENLLLLTDDQMRQPLAEPLTDRELQVLRLVAEGLSNHEIAAALTVVEGTVKTHIYNLCQKFGVTHRTAAVARARTLHILH